MNKKILFAALAVICIVASIGMYVIGNSNSALTELKDFWWMPLPLGAISLLAATRSK